ncbi:MAG: DUF3990 domain-containing protein [Hespellia sp.]|nr:DUF3990 domain-containing protein [Hespellia sp.]
MILYHGSCLEIVHPDLNHSRDNVDFGRGFYTTPIYEQAVRWCRKFKQRGKKGIVSCFETGRTSFLSVHLIYMEREDISIHLRIFVKKITVYLWAMKPRKSS